MQLSHSSHSFISPSAYRPVSRKPSHCVHDSERSFIAHADTEITSHLALHLHIKSKLAHVHCMIWPDTAASGGTG